MPQLAAKGRGRPKREVHLPKKYNEDELSKEVDEILEESDNDENYYDKEVNDDIENDLEEIFGKRRSKRIADTDSDTDFVASSPYKRGRGRPRKGIDMQGSPQLYEGE